ncbi:MAG TPA: hypothetical protein VEF04_01745 [Blastocatellia bacterium]|nr:hypothetical protein [Blastocatellia bacterium]
MPTPTASDVVAEIVLPTDRSTASAQGRWVALAVIGSLALTLVVYWLRLDDVAGACVDDGWYILLAKAIASGQGYTLINSPSQGIVPIYPPGFPWLLSLVFRFTPNFPENIWLLKSVSIVAMLGVGVASYLFFKREGEWPHYIALIASLVVVTAPGFVFLAASTVMSEPVFSLSQLLAVITVERAVRQHSQRASSLYILLGALFASFAFLTRSIALVLIAAALIYLLKERLWRLALIFSISVAVCVSPWMIYSRLHAPTPAEKKEQGNYIVESYGEQFWSKRAGVSTTGRITVRDLPERVWKNLVDIFGRDIGGMFLPQLYRPATESGLEIIELGGSLGRVMLNMGAATGTIIFSLLISLIAVIGFIARCRTRVTLTELVVIFSLGMVVIWLGLFRFILPLMPFVMLYFVTGLKSVSRWFEKLWRKLYSANHWAAPRIVIVCLLAFNAYDHFSYISAGRSSRANQMWLSDYDEQRELINWVTRELPHNAIIATSNPPLINLMTGHKTVGCNEPIKNLDYWQRLGVRYLIYLATSPVRDGDKIEKYSRVIYSSPSSCRVLELYAEARTQ